MDLEEIKSILDLIAESEVNQVTIEEGDFKIKVKKTADVVAGSASPVQYQMPAAPPQQPQQPQPSAAQQQEQGQTREPAETSETGEEGIAGKIVNSPIVGTF